MGRKVHPIGFRLGIIKDWQSRWFAERNYTEQLHEDIMLRAMVGKRLANASISRVDLERSAANQIEITLSTAKPGIVIGKGGQAVEVLRKDFETATGKKVKLNINEIKQPEIDAFLVAESIADQITRRVSYKRAMKQAIMRATRLGAKGVRIRLSGRLGGAEMARVVGEREGRVPLHTLRADIDYGQVHAHTTYGRVGVKVWIYKGDVIGPRPGDVIVGDRNRENRPPREGRPFDGPPAAARAGDRGPRPQGQGAPQGGRVGDRGPRPQGQSTQPGRLPTIAAPPERTLPANVQANVPTSTAASQATDLETNLPAPTTAAPVVHKATSAHETVVATEATQASGTAQTAATAELESNTPAPTMAASMPAETAVPAEAIGAAPATAAPAADETATRTGVTDTTLPVAGTSDIPAADAGTPSAAEAARSGEES